jgi:hypothetical protein
MAREKLKADASVAASHRLAPPAVLALISPGI